MDCINVVWRLCIISIVTLASAFVSVASATTPKVMIILDDLGNSKSDMRAFTLPDEVTFSILPQTPFGKKIALKAQQEGRAVMLHMPMQARNGKYMGPLGVRVDMSPDVLTRTFREALNSVPYAVGVNNHMGSAFTDQAYAMHVIMEEVKRQGLFFVDSRTSIHTMAQKVAEELGVPNTRRQVFLDHERTPMFLHQQFEQMKALAKKNGMVVVIAHPYPETLAFLTQYLPTLEHDGMVLASVAEYLSSNETADKSHPIADALSSQQNLLND